MKKIIALLLTLILMCFSFVACDDSTNDDTKETETTVQIPKDKVELTLENFDTYFDFVEESFFTKDSSGEVDSLRFRQYYKLKNEYKIDLEKSNVEITYNHSYCSRPIHVDFNTETFKFGDNSSNKEIFENRKINKIQMITPTDYAIFLFQPSKIEKGTSHALYYDDFELTSVNGTLYFINE